MDLGLSEKPRFPSTPSAVPRAMADRWNRIFCRMLRALRDLRRFDVNVNINGPGQVNIGGSTGGPE